MTLQLNPGAALALENVWIERGWRIRVRDELGEAITAADDGLESLTPEPKTVADLRDEYAKAQEDEVFAFARVLALLGDDELAALRTWGQTGQKPVSL